MSNEEILKRFQFDLDIGIFKALNNSLVHFKSKDIRKLAIVLSKLNYNGGYPIYKDGGIIVNIDSKKFFILKEPSECSIFNEIPEYINLYKVEDMYFND